MAKSNYLETLLLNSVFRGSTFTEPATTHISLHTADPTDAGTGTEVSGGAYARVAVTSNTTNWSAPADSAGAQQITNSNAITFPESTAAWGNVTHFGIWDASSAGNLLYHGALDTARNVDGAGITLSFAAGALAISES